jgi:predicted Zn-dependent peptidase
LKEDGITEKELHNSKEQMKGSLMLGLESTNSRMSRNGKNELLLGRHRSLDEIIEEIESVTVEKVNELARTVFAEDYALALISPDGVLPQPLRS